MRARLSLVSFIALAAAALTAQGGQPQRDSQEPVDQRPPVFRATTNYILVDMYPTRDGRFVDDLRADEVEVFEDGVRQRIETFEHVRIGGDATARRDPEDEDLSESRSRVFVVFVDTFTTLLEREPGLRLALVRFLDKLLGPNDLVGLMTPEMVATEVTLGHRGTVISDLANDARWVRRDPEERQDQREFAWENCYGARGGGGRAAEMKGRRRTKQTIDAMKDLVTHLRDLREERKAVLLVTAGWLFTGETILATPGDSETRSCELDRLAMLKMDLGGLLRSLTRAANRSNVSFYPVNSRRADNATRVEPSFRNGRAINPAMVRQRERRVLELSQQQLESLAEDTDGVAELGTNNLDRVTERIIGDTSEYYLLGYQSPNSRPDGRFRSISVKVQRPGVRVRSRPGYGGETPLTAPNPAETIVSRGPVVEPRVLFALETVERFDTNATVWMRTVSTAVNDAQGGAFWFVGEVGSFLRGQRAWTGGVRADVQVLAADKTVVLAKRFGLSPPETTFGLRVPDAGNLSPGDYTVRVKLTSVSDDTLAVHDSMRVTVPSATAGLGSAMLWRRGASSRLEYLPTADPRFRRNERMRLEFSTVSGSEASARVLDRLGQPLQVPTTVTERADASGAFTWVVIDTPLAGLAPGDYAIEVTQDDVSHVTAFRMIP